MDKDPTLRSILLDYVNAYEGWLTKGQLYLVAEQEEYSPESAGRELRYLEEDKLIQVDYYKGKRKQTLAKYARIGEMKPIPQKQKFVEVERDGIRTMVYA